MTKRKMARGGIAALAVLIAGASTAQQAPATMDALYVAQHLDVMSFPNAMHPRRREGATLPMDYGFTHFSPIEHGVAAMEDDGSWYFGVTILADHGKRKRLCILDQAQNGGSYRTAFPIDVQLGDDGLFHAVGTTDPHASC